MSRKATMIHTSIWEQDEFIERSSGSQLVYLMLCTQPNVAATGLLAMTTRRWARYTSGRLEAVETNLQELEQREFIWMDQTAEELIIRTWVKHNVLGAPTMETAATNQFDGITSRKLRLLLAAEYHGALNSKYETPLFPSPDTLSDTLSGKLAEPHGVWTMVNGAWSKESDVSRARADVVEVTADRPTPDDTDTVWETYREFHPQAKLTTDRRRLIERRLREWPVATLVAAIRGNHADPWCVERGHHGIDLIIRNADKIERYAAVAQNGPPRPAASGSAAGRMLARAHQTAESEVRRAG